MNPVCILHDDAVLVLTVVACLPSSVVHRVMSISTHPLEFVLYLRQSSSSTGLLTPLNAHLVLVLRCLKKVSTSSIIQWSFSSTHRLNYEPVQSGIEKINGQ